MHGFLKNKLVIYTLFLTLTLILSSSLSGQNQGSKKTIIQNGDTIVLQAISLTNLTENIEVIVKEISKINEENKPDPKMGTADSLYLVALKQLTEENKAIIDNEIKIAKRALEDALQQWANYKSKLGEWQSLFSNRSKSLSKNLTKTKNLITIWELTLKDARQEKAPSGIILNIRDVLNELKSLRNYLKSDQLDVFSKQSKLTELALLIDETIKDIETQKTSLSKEYFIQDSPAIWNTYDSTFVLTLGTQSIKDTWDSTSKSLNIFYQANKDQFYIQIIAIILLIILLYFLNKRISDIEFEDKKLSGYKKILDNHILAALILGFLATLWVYPIRQLVVDDIFQLILLVLILLFLPKVVDKKYRVVLYYMLGLHIINQIHLVFPSSGLISRLMLLAGLGFVFAVLYKLQDKEGPLYQDLNDTHKKYLSIFLRFNMALLLIPFFGNIFGFLGLSLYVNNIIVNSLINAFITFVSLYIFIGVISLLIHSNYLSVFHSLRKNSSYILKSLIKYSTILAVGLWIKSILLLIGIYNNFIDWIVSVFESSWQITDDITIAFGSVLTFILIIFLTFFFSKFIRVILEEEIFPRIKLPRGVPGAISMVVRYFIVGWGIIISITALGINLSDFGLMAGALGVGIGFGLQNIVFNFIAGLVLAFERPIQAGDTIEVGTVMGIVKSIGVRSSTVLTFDGSEVIVPNGNLISNDVINWTLTHRRKRRDIHVGVEYGSDPHVVMEILRKAADGNINVLQDPEPWILFEGFGDSSLNFRLRIWTSMDVGLTTKSQVTIAIYDGLNEAGITIPFPQQDLHVKSIEPEVEKIILQSSKTSSTKKPTKKI